MKKKKESHTQIPPTPPNAPSKFWVSFDNGTQPAILMDNDAAIEASYKDPSAYFMNEDRSSGWIKCSEMNFSPPKPPNQTIEQEWLGKNPAVPESVSNFSQIPAGVKYYQIEDMAVNLAATKKYLFQASEKGNIDADYHLAVIEMMQLEDAFDFVDRTYNKLLNYCFDPMDYSTLDEEEDNLYSVFESYFGINEEKLRTYDIQNFDLNDVRKNFDTPSVVHAILLGLDNGLFVLTDYTANLFISPKKPQDLLYSLVRDYEIRTQLAHEFLEKCLDVEFWLDEVTMDGYSPESDGYDLILSAMFNQKIVNIFNKFRSLAYINNFTPAFTVVGEFYLNGYCDYDGEDTIIDTPFIEEAYKCFVKAAENNDPKACYYLGSYYEKDDYQQFDIKRAVYFYQKAVRLGSEYPFPKLVKLDEGSRHGYTFMEGKLFIEEAGSSLARISDHSKQSDESQVVISESNFVQFSNATFLEKKSKLLWPINYSGNFSFNDANIFCKKFDLGGYSDWRLPTFKELEDLFTKTPPLLNLKSGLWLWSADSGDFIFYYNGNSSSIKKYPIEKKKVAKHSVLPVRTAADSAILTAKN